MCGVEKGHARPQQGEEVVGEAQEKVDHVLGCDGFTGKPVFVDRSIPSVHMHSLC